MSRWLTSTSQRAGLWSLSKTWTRDWWESAKVYFSSYQMQDQVRTFMLQIAVLQNHQQGRDTHLRQVVKMFPILSLFYWAVPVGREEFSSSQFSGESAQSGGELCCVSSRVQQLHHCWSQAVPEHKVISDRAFWFLGLRSRWFFFRWLVHRDALVKKKFGKFPSIVDFCRLWQCQVYLV